MDLSRGKKVALLVATVWPVIYMLLFMVVWLWLFTSIMSRSTSGPAGMDNVFFGIAPLHILTMLESFALMGVYAYLAFKRLVADETQRLMWLLIVVLTGVIGQLIFFFLKVWPEPDADPVVAPTSTNPDVMGAASEVARSVGSLLHTEADDRADAFFDR